MPLISGVLFNRAKRNQFLSAYKDCMVSFSTLLSSAKHAEGTFQALAERLRARDESLIALKITANDFTFNNEHLLTL